MELLLERGADIDAVDVSGWTPLYLACDHLHPAVVESLLGHNADFDIMDNDGLTPLQMALYKPSSPNHVLQLMAKPVVQCDYLQQKLLIMDESKSVVGDIEEDPVTIA